LSEDVVDMKISLRLSTSRAKKLLIAGAVDIVVGFPLAYIAILAIALDRDAGPLFSILIYAGTLLALVGADFLLYFRLKRLFHIG
jgi:hypothetical protein